MGLQVKDCPSVYQRTLLQYDTICNLVHCFYRIPKFYRFPERYLNEEFSSIFVQATRRWLKISMGSFNQQTRYG